MRDYGKVGDSDMLRRWLFRLIQAWSVLLVFGNSATAQEGDMRCKLYATAEQFPRFNMTSWANERRGDAVIFGKPYPVPELRLQFQNEGGVVRPMSLDVFYIWKWLEYPYPEHAWGAWSDAYDWFRCTVGDDGKLTVPSFTVRPRGWYKGFYTYFPWPKKPYFDYIELTVQVEGCAPKLRIALTDLDWYRKSTAVVKVSCGSPIEVTFKR